MTLILDASGLYAQANGSEPAHAAVVAAIDAESGPLVTTAAVAAEADYLIGTRIGADVQLAFLDDLAEGTFGVECLTRQELRAARDLARRYRDLELGLADSSLVVLAQRFGSRRILTLDQRAFRTVVPLQGGAFTILPADI